MNEFEFLAVFISIVIGLGVTHILYGLARIIYNRSRQQLSMLHIIWTVNVLLIVLLNWWIFFLWSDYPEWSFDIYLLLICWAIPLYMMTVVLYPPDIAPDVSYDALFEQNRKWLFGTFLLFVAIDVVETAVRGELFRPKYFLVFVLHYAVLAAIAIFTPNRRYQLFFAWYMLGSLTLWSLVVRRILGG